MRDTFARIGGALARLADGVHRQVDRLPVPFMLVVRALAGFVVGAVMGLVADFALQTQGYWVVASMAGAIAGLASLYVDSPFKRQGAVNKVQERSSKKQHARGKK